MCNKGLRIFLIVMLCIGTIGLFQGESSAITRSLTIWGSQYHSVIIYGHGEGPGNFDKWPGRVTVTVDNFLVQGVCNNGGDNGPPNQLGKPFYYDIAVSQTSASDTWAVDSNGDFDFSFTFTEEQIFGEGCPDEACTKKNWTCAVDDVTGEPILFLSQWDVDILLQVELCDNNDPPNCGWYDDVHIEGTCYVDPNDSSVSCTEDTYESWDWKAYLE